MILNLDEPTSHGWDESGNVIWSSVCYPNDVGELLIARQENEEEFDFSQNSNLEDDFDDDIVDDED